MAQAIEYLKSQDCEILIHAGDMEVVESLDILKNSGLIYTSVFGNNDYNLVQYQNNYKIHKEPYYFKIKETLQKQAQEKAHHKHPCIGF